MTGAKLEGVKTDEQTTGFAFNEPEKLAKFEAVKAGIEEGKTTEPARFILETLAETQAARPDLYIDVQGYMKNLLAKVENFMQEPEMRQKFGLEPAEKTTETGSR